MSIFKSLVNVLNQPKHGFSGDIFAQRPVEVFLNAREHLTYFNSLHGVDASRNFYLELKTAILPLLEFLDSPDHLAIIDTVIFKNRTSERRNQDSNVSAFLKKVDSEGFKLLELNGEVTFDSLKKAYKVAAKKYHPDFGGDENKMKALNNAYAKFHDILCTGDTKRFSDNNEFSGSVNSEDRECSSVNDVIYLSSIALAQSLIDVWAVDEAVSVLKKLEKLGNLETYQDLSLIDAYNFAHSLLKGAERLHHIEQTESANWLLASFEIIFNAAKKLDPFIADRRKQVKAS